VTAYVDSISVDRGTRVRSGQVMARLVAPELAAQRAEAQSKLQAAEAQRVEADSKLASDQSTFDRLKSASATPGVVAGNDLEVAQRTVEADRAKVEAMRGSAEAAKSGLKSISEIEGYLEVRAPFDGVVTERNVHPGSLVGPATGAAASSLPMVRVEKISKLRLVVPVPEKYSAGMTTGTKVDFSVRTVDVARVASWWVEAWRLFTPRIGTWLIIALILGAVVLVAGLVGMIPVLGQLAALASEVLWPVRRSEATLFVPASAVARTTEATFVIRIRDGNTEWVNVQTGEQDGKSIEVFGGLREGDEVAVRGTDELRAGNHVTTKPFVEAAPAK